MFKKLNLFSKTEMKVLGVVSVKDGELYERQIAGLAKISVGSANAILNKFTKLGLVKCSREGKMKFYQRNDGNPLLRQFKASMTINNLLPVLEKIRPMSRRVILFGSCAEGRNGEKSDIDLMVLTSEKDKIRRIMDGYPQIQAILFDSVEYAQLQKKDKPLYDRISRGIELGGEENG